MNSEGSKLHADHVIRSAYPAPGDSSAYADGDLIGTKLTFTDVVANDRGGGLIKNVIIVDLDGNSAEMDLFLFDTDLETNTGTGAKTNWSTGDNAAADICDSDALNIIGAINISTGDYAAAGAGIAAVEVDLPFYVPGRNMYGIVVSGGTPQFNSTGTLLVKLAIERD